MIPFCGILEMKIIEKKICDYEEKGLTVKGQCKRIWEMNCFTS